MTRSNWWRGWSRRSALAILLVVTALAGCQRGVDREQALRSDFRRVAGQITLPAGTILLHSPLEFAAGAHDIEVKGDPGGSVLQLASDFKGRAAIFGAGVTQVRLTGFKITGARANLVTNQYLPDSNTAFVDYYDKNGMIFVNSQRVAIERVTLSGIESFAVLISHSDTVAVRDVTVEDSGTLNAKGNSNTTGGILLEEGTRHFVVEHCHIKAISGNGIWTHSRSNRNEDGVIRNNEIWGTPRDAIQVGHALKVEVTGNTGGRIGFPVEQVDLPGEATPVAIDSAGDVSGATYSSNRFRDVNGQCIDLDGFHDGRVLDNSCVNEKPASDYPLSHVGIVFGNSNPTMTSENVVVRGNLIQGFGYGGVYLIGSAHEISGNRFVDVNRNHCTGDMRTPRCNYAPDEPGMLRSGIYLAGHAARPASTRHNIISGNYIDGFGMDRWCIAAGPGVSLAENEIRKNTCAVSQGKGSR